jgi:hypothetical protein
MRPSPSSLLAVDIRSNFANPIDSQQSYYTNWNKVTCCQWPPQKAEGITGGLGDGDHFPLDL